MVWRLTSPNSLPKDSEEKFMPNRPTSYRKLFSYASKTNDIIEKDLLKKIQSDYEMYHIHDLKSFEDILNEKEIECPKCKSKNIKVHGYDENAIKRYKCKDCLKTFNLFTNTLFTSSKINIKAWFAYLECLLSGTSVKAACLTAKISLPTGSNWLNKIFIVLNNYQENIKLNKNIYIDETYVHVDSSDIVYFEEVGKIKKVKKQPRGISRNKICILLATDNTHSFAEIVCKGRPQRLKNLQICSKHIERNSTIIGDEDTSLTLTANELDLNRVMIKSNTEEAYNELEPIDQLCNRLKFFLNKHRGFSKDELENYLNLFIFIENERNKNTDLYIMTKALLKMLFSYKKQ